MSKAFFLRAPLACCFWRCDVLLSSLRCSSMYFCRSGPARAPSSRRTTTSSLLLHPLRGVPFAFAPYHRALLPICTRSCCSAPPTPFAPFAACSSFPRSSSPAAARSSTYVARHRFLRPMLPPFPFPRSPPCCLHYIRSHAVPARRTPPTHAHLPVPAPACPTTPLPLLLLPTAPHHTHARSRTYLYLVAPARTLLLPFAPRARRAFLVYHPVDACCCTAAVVRCARRLVHFALLPRAPAAPRRASCRARAFLRVRSRRTAHACCRAACRSRAPCARRVLRSRAYRVLAAHPPRWPPARRLPAPRAPPRARRRALPPRTVCTRALVCRSFACHAPRLLRAATAPRRRAAPPRSRLRAAYHLPRRRSVAMTCSAHARTCCPCARLPLRLLPFARALPYTPVPRACRRHVHHLRAGAAAAPPFTVRHARSPPAAAFTHAHTFALPPRSASCHVPACCLPSYLVRSFIYYTHARFAFLYTTFRLFRCTALSPACHV